MLTANGRPWNPEDSHDDDEYDDDNDDNSHPGGVVSQGNLTVPPTKPLVDLITGPEMSNQSS